MLDQRSLEITKETYPEKRTRTSIFFGTLLVKINLKNKKNFLPPHFGRYYLDNGRFCTFWIPLKIYFSLKLFQGQRIWWSRKKM